MKIFRTILTAMLIGAAACQLTAGDLYVNAKGGKKKGPGTKEAPFKTISDAVKKAFASGAAKDVPFLVATNGDISTLIGGQWLGILYCLLAAICYGIYSPLNKKQTYDTDLALAVIYGASAVWCMSLSVLSGNACMPTAFQWVGRLLFGVVVNALSFMFWVKALARGNTAILSNLIYLTPVVSLVFTHVFLGEEITFWSVFGLALICLGAVVQFRGETT